MDVLESGDCPGIRAMPPVRDCGRDHLTEPIRADASQGIEGAGMQAGMTSTSILVTFCPPEYADLATKRQRTEIELERNDRSTDEVV